MAGLINQVRSAQQPGQTQGQPPQQEPAQGQAPQPQQAMQQPAAQQQSAPASGFGEQATPEEQEAYDKAIVGGLQLMYQDDNAFQALLETMKASMDNPPRSLANAAMLVMQQLEERQNVPGEVLLPAAAEILEQVGEVANDAGIFAVDQTMLDAAAQELVRTAADTYGVDPTELQEMLESVPMDYAESIARQQDQAAGVIAQYQQQTMGAQPAQAQPSQPPAQPQQPMRG